jgi:hypothetical protein
MVTTLRQDAFSLAVRGRLHRDGDRPAASILARARGRHHRSNSLGSFETEGSGENAPETRDFEIVSYGRTR